MHAIFSRFLTSLNSDFCWSNEKWTPTSITHLDFLFSLLQTQYVSRTRLVRGLSRPVFFILTIPHTFQAETTLRPPSNLIAPDVFTLEESTRKSGFLNLVDSIGLKVCAGQGTGAPAAFARTNMVTLRAETLNFAGIDDVSINMACSDCPTYVKQTAKMTLGKTLEATYKSWSCSSSETCSGACILSTQVGLTFDDQ